MENLKFKKQIVHPFLVWTKPKVPEKVLYLPIHKEFKCMNYLMVQQKFINSTNLLLCTSDLSNPCLILFLIVNTYLKYIYCDNLSLVLFDISLKKIFW